MFSHAIRHLSDTAPGALPYDAEVEYIESSGTQYIDTGIVGSTPARVKIKFSISPDCATNNSLFGAFSTNNRVMIYITKLDNGKNRIQVGCGTATAKNVGLDAEDDSIHEIVVNFEADNLWAEVDGGTRTTISGATSATNSTNLFLFDRSGNQNSIKARIYSATIWSGSNMELTRDYVSVRVGNEYCLYDKANPTGGTNNDGLYHNAGSGAFSGGSDKAKPQLPYDAEVQYIESTGTQYIDTGVVPNGADEVVIVAALAAATSGEPGFFGVRQDASGNNGLASWWGPSSFWCYGWGNSGTGNSSFSASFTAGQQYTFRVNNEGIFLDGTKRVTYTSQQLPTTTRNIWVFALNNGGSRYSPSGSYRVFSMLIYQSGTLVRDFIPVRVGTEYCLYDRANPTGGDNGDGLYHNKGTGAFLGSIDKPSAGTKFLVSKVMGDSSGKIKPVLKHYDMAMSYLRNECNGSAPTLVNTSFPSGKYTTLDYTPTYVHHLFTGWGTTPYYDSELDYIELTGTQFLDTKLHIDPTKQNVKSTCRIQFTGTGRQLMGFASIDNGYWGVANGGTNYEVGATTTTTTSTTMPKTGGVDTLVWEHFTDANQTLTLKGTGGASDLLITRPKSMTPGTYQIGAIPGNGGYRCVAKIYAYTIEVDGKVVRDYIPVRCGTVGMLYDKVTNQMFPSSTNTSFIAGNDVPAGCELVDYVEFTGTDTSTGSYVDTGITPGNNDIQFEIQFLRNYSISAYNYIIGATSDSSTNISNTGAYGVSYGSSTTTGGIRLNCLLPADAYIRVPLSDLPMSEVVTAKYTGHSCIVNGVEYQAGGTHTACEYPLYIGANNKVGTASNVTRGAYVYYCKIWKSGVLVRDFVPVKDTNDVGALYDKVSRQLFYSQNQSIPLNAATTYTPPTGTEILPSDQVMYHVPMVYAQWQSPTTVTFDATTNGGAMPSGWTAPDYYEGQPFGTLPTPTHATLNFTGWYLNGNKVIATDPVQANATLVAQYAASSYSVDISNGDWVLQSPNTNPDISTYDGVYQSDRYHGSPPSSGCVVKMYIDVVGYTNFKVYIRSYGENSWSYVVACNPDIDPTDYNQAISNATANTETNSTSTTSISAYTEANYTLNGGSHRICIVYLHKDSYTQGDDRGYVLIPKQQ